MRILLTGASGFIGSRLAQRAAERGLTVLPYAGEITDIAQNDVQADLICHLAAVMSGPTLEQTNVTGTQAVIALAQRRNTPVLFASTSAVYRPSPEPRPLHEMAPLEPRNDYGKSKLRAEGLLQESGLPVRILRLFNVYGPKQADNYLIPQLLAHLKGGKPTQLQSPGSWRDFIHLDDICEAFLHAAVVPFSPGCEIYNIGSSQGVSVRQLADRLAHRLGKPPLSIPDAPANAQTSADAFVADTQAFTRRFGWRPQISLADGIATL